jgi:hypothetical protein
MYSKDLGIVILNLQKYLFLAVDFRGIHDLVDFPITRR